VLTLVFSVLVTVYLIIPEAIFRFFFGFFIPTRTYVLTRTETAFRAVLISFFPFWIAMGLSWDIPGPRSWPLPVAQNSAQQRRIDYKIVTSGLYSEAEFAKSAKVFWPALTRCSRRQARLAFWYFLIVAGEAILLGVFASRYASYSAKPFYRWLSDRLLSPYISQWHPLLTQDLVPGTVVQADILCTNDTLYRGIVSQYFMKEGELSGIILQKPRRFDRDRYMKAKSEGVKPEKNDYWISIPSQHLYFFPDKIVNMNLSYVTVAGQIASPAAVEKFLAEEFSPLTERLGKLRVFVVGQKQSSPADQKKE
jgi:hypothetical protein